MSFKGSQSTGPEDHFHFEYEGRVYRQTKEDAMEGYFYVDDCMYEVESSPELLSMIRGFVQSALQGKTIHVKVL